MGPRKIKIHKTDTSIIDSYYQYKPPNTIHILDICENCHKDWNNRLVECEHVYLIQDNPGNHTCGKPCNSIAMTEEALKNINKDSLEFLLECIGGIEYEK